jgi:hypothetical protein
MPVLAAANRLWLEKLRGCGVASLFVVDNGVLKAKADAAGREVSSSNATATASTCRIVDETQEAILSADFKQAWKEPRKAFVAVSSSYVYTAALRVGGV